MKTAGFLAVGKRNEVNDACSRFKEVTEIENLVVGDVLERKHIGGVEHRVLGLEGFGKEFWVRIAKFGREEGFVLLKGLFEYLGGCSGMGAWCFDGISFGSNLGIIHCDLGTGEDKFEGWDVRLWNACFFEFFA